MDINKDIVDNNLSEAPLKLLSPDNIDTFRRLWYNFGGENKIFV